MHIDIIMYLYVISTIVIQEVFMISEPRSFTRGEPLEYYYRNESISITAIRWGIDPSDNKDRDRDFYNPVSINDVFNSIGSGAIQLSCFYRQSPVTIVGDIPIDMKGVYYITQYFFYVQKCILYL